MSLTEMVHDVVRCPDGTIHVQNVLGFALGQHSVFSKDGYERWKKQAQKETQNKINEHDDACGCGLAPGFVREMNGKVWFDANSKEVPPVAAGAEQAPVAAPVVVAPVQVQEVPAQEVEASSVKSEPKVRKAPKVKAVKEVKVKVAKVKAVKVVKAKKVKVVKPKAAKKEKGKSDPSRRKAGFDSWATRRKLYGKIGRPKAKFAKSAK